MPELPRLTRGLGVHQDLKVNVLKCDGCGEEYDTSNVPILVRELTNEEWRTVASCKECGSASYTAKYVVYDHIQDKEEEANND